MTSTLFLLFAVLVIVAGVSARRRVRETRESVITDDIVRRIETIGRVDSADVEPLDIDEARVEEDEFWDRTWDEPDELR
ncbi:MAG: hypothetical protein MJB57_10285 [Gemmatimonadetes bacterium]|nr:hypothetical protein [Gemmatimonadota bacterium]